MITRNATPLDRWRTYSDLIQLQTFDERFEYAKLAGKVGIDTFGSQRYLNQFLYHNNKEWRRVRDKVIMRDNGCDLAVDGHDILYEKIIVHHLNPITIEDIQKERDWILDPEFLVCVTHRTHNAIHYGDDRLIRFPKERTPNDTCPWKQ